MMMTVNEVSKLAGVSIRTLQYYDKIGLLHPTGYTDAGYRLYDDADLERLQHILLFRELEFPLKDIKMIVNSPDFDRSKAYEIDVLSGKRIDLGVLDYVPDIKNNPQAMEVITELVAKLPDMEIDGVMSEEMEARVWELRMPDLPQEEQLAVELDRLSYDYDTVLYHDSTRNMTENVSELAESIKQGDTGHLTTWLVDIISEGAVPEEIKRATELLEKLTEYKPLAKIEEAEEQNYNMIDNVLNNGVGEKAQREENKRMEEKPTVRLSLKSRLAEKKSQVEGQSKEHDVQENEKKSQREM